MSGILWRTTRTVDIPKFYEVPTGTRVRTRAGRILLKVPKICRVHGTLFFDQTIFDGLRKNIAQSFKRRANEAFRRSFGITEPEDTPGVLTYDKFKADMDAILGHIGVKPAPQPAGEKG